MRYAALANVLGGSSRPGGNTFAKDLRDAGGALVFSQLGEATDMVLALASSTTSSPRETLKTRTRVGDLARDALDLCHHYLHHGRWQDVNVVWREAYAWAAIICASVESEPTDALRFLDLALLMAGPSHRCMHTPSFFKYVEWIERALSTAEGATERPREDVEIEGKTQKECFGPLEGFLHRTEDAKGRTNGHILLLNVPSLFTFQTRVLDAARPAIPRNSYRNS